MSIKRVVIEIQLRIEREHVAAFRHHQRVDFDHRAIACVECAKQSVEQFRRGFELRRFEGELLRQLARLKRLHARQWIYRFAQNFLRRFRGNCFDLNTAFRACHHQGCRDRTIAQDGKIKFARDLGRFRHQNFAHHPTGRACLMRDQSLPEHFFRNFARFLRRFDDMDAAFESVLESPLPTAAGVHLGFDHKLGRRGDIASSQFTRDRFGFVRSRSDFATGCGHSKFLEQLLRLVLVNVHRVLGAMD